MEMMRVDKLRKLASFIKALENAGIYEFEIDEFYNRLKLQKFVFLARSFGIADLDYPYNMYLRGPYSPSLADDYYELADAENWEKYVDKRYVAKIERSKDFEKFVKLVKGRDSTWLEVAATMVGFWKHLKRYVDLGVIKNEELEEKIKQLTKNRKPFASLQMINEIFESLKQYGLINTV